MANGCVLRGWNFKNPGKVSCNNVALKVILKWKYARALNTECLLHTGPVSNKSRRKKKKKTRQYIKISLYQLFIVFFTHTNKYKSILCLKLQTKKGSHYNDGHAALKNQSLDFENGNDRYKEEIISKSIVEKKLLKIQIHNTVLAVLQTQLTGAIING